MFRKLVFAAVLASAASMACADPVRFNFTFAEVKGSARATGYIVLETDAIANPGNANYDIPGPAISALSVTVTGAKVGNGTFGIDDFCSFVFETNGGTLDFSRELVGQPTNDDPWGTPVDMTGGDFNLFSCSGENANTPAHRYANPAAGDGQSAPTPEGSPSGQAPDGVWYFTLGANGGMGEEMVLVTMAPQGAPGPGPGLAPSVAVPAGNTWTLAGLCVLLAGLGMAFVRTRR
jgi:hypothetical protein